MTLHVEQTDVHINHTRSIVRAITWRIIATLTTIVAAFIITGAWDLALKVGAIEITAKLFLYYLHERAWLMTSWGVKKVN